MASPLHYEGILCQPIADGDHKVFGGGGEELKVGDVQLLHLDGLTELNDEPEEQNTEHSGGRNYSYFTI